MAALSMVFGLPHHVSSSIRALSIVVRLVFSLLTERVLLLRLYYLSHEARHELKMPQKVEIRSRGGTQLGRLAQLHANIQADTQL